MRVSDFATAHYLGLRHSSRELPPWARLSTGVPAAMSESPAAKAVAQYVAGMQRQEAGVIAASTLHLFWDLMGHWPPAGARLFADREVYRVAQWGVERAAGRGIPVQCFRHLDSGALASALQRPPVRMPMVVTDGWCPLCGAPAPLDDYASLLEPYGGWLLIDDTQAFGILGARSSPAGVWGNGGGGTLPYFGLSYPRTVVITSLAKAFGAPLAVMAGPRRFIRRFLRLSETRMFASPPSEANLAAARRALSFNAAEGDKARSQLLANVRYFRSRLREKGIPIHGAPFPVQALRMRKDSQAPELQHSLAGRGLRATVVAHHAGRPSTLCCLLRRDHKLKEIRRLVDGIACFFTTTVPQKNAP